MAEVHASPLERDYRMMTWRRTLLFVPGIAVLVCGTGWLAVTLFSPRPQAAVFFVGAFPFLLLITLVPALALGGTLHVRRDTRRLELTRSRAFVRGTPVVVPLDRGPVTLRLHDYGGQWRGMGRLFCSRGGEETVLVPQAPVAALRRVVDDLATPG